MTHEDLSKNLKSESTKIFFNGKKRNLGVSSLSCFLTTKNDLLQKKGEKISDNEKKETVCRQR